MGATCCGNNESESKSEVNLKNMAKEPSAPQTRPPAIMGTNEDIKLRDEVDAIWLKYDLNKNGVLDRDEAYAFLKDMMSEVTGQIPTQEEIESNFRILDEDGSGDVSKEETYKFIKGYRIGHALREMMLFSTEE